LGLEVVLEADVDIIEARGTGGIGVTKGLMAE